MRASAVVVLASALLAIGVTGPARAAPFTNPIVPENSADPFMVRWHGHWLLTYTDADSANGGPGRLVMRVARTLAGLARAPAHVIWDPVAAGEPKSRSEQLWAPELHRLRAPGGGWHWYVYYAASDGGNFVLDERSHVLESRGDDPLGPYRFKASTVTDAYAIDATVWRRPSDGALFYFWSRLGPLDRGSSIYVSRMSNPWTLTGPKTLVSAPSYPWETIGAPVNEAPEVLTHGDRLNLIFSASWCVTDFYAMGRLTVPLDADLTDPATWMNAKYPQPIFESSPGAGVYAPGHAGFFESPDGTQSWFAYGADDRPGAPLTGAGCLGKRTVRAQRFSWNADGTPALGIPARTGVPLAGPSGESPRRRAHARSRQPRASASRRGQRPAVVRDGAARFEVLSPTLIRLEYAADGHFEDRPTMTAVRRVLRRPRFTTAVRGDARVIHTRAMTLRWVRGSGPFRASNTELRLRVGRRFSDVRPSWTDSPGNLGGWRRALDNQVGPLPLHDGVLSRNGWYLLDDSRTVLLTGGGAGFAQRPTHAGPYQDGYLFAYGHDYARGLADLRRLTGPAPLPPRKAFGVWFSRYWPYSEQDLHDLLGTFRAERVPLDTLSVDTDWKRVNNPVFAPAASLAAGADPTKPYSWNGWEWNSSIFPDPQRFLAWAHGEGLAVTLNIHPSISADDPQWQATQERSGGLRTTTGLCQILMASPAACGVFDWVNPQQLDAYFALHEPLERQGVDFWWLDWCCDDSRADAPGLTADTWINSRYARREAARGLRWPAFSRIGASYQAGDGGDGGGPGAFAEHRYTMHFTGDTCATWPMLAFEARFSAAEGNIGLPYVTHDIGSFNGVPVHGICAPSGKAGHLPDDIYTRWVQLGTFQPLDRLHSNHGDRLPWQYGPKAHAVAADFLRLREALIPYLYTLARNAYDTGQPIVRSLYLQWPELEAAYRNPSEYTLGRDLLVAPVAAPGDPAPTTVWIPPGQWIDYFTGARYRGPETVRLMVPLERMPVFARAGAVIATQPDLPTSAAGPQSPLIVTAWPGANRSFELYDDEGQGFGYRHGAFSWTPIAQRRSQRGASVTIGPARGSFPGALRARAWEVRLAGVDRPRLVTVNSRPLAAVAPGTAGGYWYRRASRTLFVRTRSLPVARAVVVTAG